MAPAPATEIPSVCELVMRIQERGAVRIVGIEGSCGAGKTYLGRSLTKQLNGSLVSTDCFVATQGGHTDYVDRFNLDRLKRVVAEALRLSQPVILEGICLRDTISRVSSMPVDLFIYVKVLSGEIWNYGVDLEDFEQGGGESAAPQPHLSVHRYHHRTQPHKRADLIYVRQEGPEG